MLVWSVGKAESKGKIIMKVIKLFLGSSYELEPDRARIGDLIRWLNDAYEKRFIHLHLIKWEDIDSYYNQVSKQQQYDEQIRQCDLFVGLFWHRAGKHTLHEVEVARANLSPENILIFRKTAPFRADHEGSEEVKRFLERFPDEEEMKGLEAELGEFLKKQDTFFPYADFSELGRVLSEKLEAYCASATVTEEEKARTYSTNTLQIHVIASPEVEPDLARLGDLVRYLDENSKHYCRIKMIDVLPGSDIFVSLCQISAPEDFQREIESAIEENAKPENKGKPRLFFCMKYLEHGEKKDSSLKELENKFQNILSHFPDRYAHAPEMKLHFMLQLERLQKEISFSDAMLVVKDGVICQKTGETLNPLMSCGDLASLRKDGAYRKMKDRLRELDAELADLKERDLETDRDLTEEFRRCYEKKNEIEERIREKQNGYLKLARTLEEMIGQEQDELIQRVREKFQAGEIDQALELLPKPEDQRKEREERKRRHEAENLRAYQVCKLTIDCLQAGNALKNRQSIFVQYELLIDIAGDLRSEEKEADAHYDYGSLLDECALYDKALEHHEKALSIRLRVLGDGHEDVVKSYLCIGSVWSDKGDYDKALEYSEKALSISLRKHGEDHLSVATSYNNIGTIFLKKGDDAKADEYFEKALSIFQRVLGEDHLLVATVYDNIGTVSGRIFLYDEALEYHEKALSIRLRVLGEDHPDGACSYNNIGGVWAGKRDYDKALEYYEKALSIWLNALGEDHPDVATSYNNIAGVWSEKGDNEKAQEYLEKPLSFKIRVLGKDHPDVATGYCEIGDKWLDKGEYDKALENYEKSLSILLRLFGEDHSDVADCYNSIGQILSEKGDDDKALENYEKSLSIRLRLFGEDHPDVASCYNSIGQILSKKGEYDKALENYEKSLSIYLRLNLEGHPAVAMCYHNIGDVWAKKGDNDKAQDYYTKSASSFMNGPIGMMLLAGAIQQK